MIKPRLKVLSVCKPSQFTNHPTNRTMFEFMVDGAMTVKEVYDGLLAIATDEMNDRDPIGFTTGEFHQAFGVAQAEISDDSILAFPSLPIRGMFEFEEPEDVERVYVTVEFLDV